MIGLANPGLYLFYLFRKAGTCDTDLFCLNGGILQIAYTSRCDGTRIHLNPRSLTVDASSFNGILESNCVTARSYRIHEVIYDE